MNNSRRKFITQSVSALSLAATSNVINFPLYAKEISYGAERGIARLNWNENPYGPSKKALQAIIKSSYESAYYPDHLVKRLKEEGFWVRGVDLKYPDFGETEADDFIIGSDTHANPGMSIISTNSGAASIFFGDPQRYYAGYIQYQHNGDYMRIGSGNGAEQIRVNSTGVGIGNTSPGEKLEVTGNIKTSGSFIGKSQHNQNL